MAEYGSNYDYGESPLYKDEGGVIDEDRLFYFLPNWLYDVSVTYINKTVISVTRLGYEQRRGLLAHPIRTEKITVTCNENYEKIWNFLLYNHASTFYIPVYTEPLRVNNTGSLMGVSALSVNNFANYYSLRNLTSTLLIIDKGNEYHSEVLPLDTFAGLETINILSPIEGIFFGETSIIYPLFPCILADKERVDVTDTMTQIRLEFYENIEQ